MHGVVADEVLFHEPVALDPEALHRLVRCDRVLLLPRPQALGIRVDACERHPRAGALAGMTARALAIEHRACRPATSPHRSANGYFGGAFARQIVLQPLHLCEELLVVLRRGAEQTER